MNNPLPDILAHFTKHKWHYTQEADRPILRMSHSDENGAWRCVAAVEWEETQFAFYSLLDAKAREKVRPAVAELVARINYGLFTGSFEMDWRDGEILLKTSVLLYGDALPDETILRVVGTNLQTMNEYFPAIMKVLYLGVKPEDAMLKEEDDQKVRARFELN